jgi:hypothetical protein
MLLEATAIFLFTKPSPKKFLKIKIRRKLVIKFYPLLPNIPQNLFVTLVPIFQ